MCQSNPFRAPPPYLVSSPHNPEVRTRGWINGRLLNIYGVNDVRQNEIYTAECLSLMTWEVEMATERFKRYKSPVTDQIPGAMIQAGCRTLCSVMRKLITVSLFGIRKNCLNIRRSQILQLLVRKMINLSMITVEAQDCYQLHRKVHPTFSLKVNTTCR
jgi:hypothetical protein